MGNSISIDNLVLEIDKELKNYSAQVTKGIKESVDKVAEEVNTEIKNKVTFKQPTGKYVKAFRIKNTYEGVFSKRKTWHVANGQYRLTHLLENGHQLHQGGRARAYPHITYGEEVAKRRMEELSKEVIKNAGN